ncbi:GNAT family N-acetyltransferase [Luteimonas kalidii]|uniref:GNAT family N-acetyltransferase n=1 Tax=Luteimonas kalidii TaxID=3042025 RepID=A0ABT6JX30_9GAMM|nr:GNAT family N-acetyltransferase [Luteimonas kalidii]MDH5835252.1 GNAT family N-acetyltransferase [Luteimonas kalidii]
MHIRPASTADRDAILALVPRLAEHGTPPGRDRERISAVDTETIAAVIDLRSPEVEVLVAEDGDGLLGFVHVRTVTDYYTQAPIGHVSDLVVAEKTEGRGVGRALIEAAQSWARDRGYRMMQLYVLPENTGARALYERMGYRGEWIKYVTPLS